jgi:hypothetical protein
MKATASALVVVAALLSAACGEGRAIFNVDVYSFIQGSGNDTIPYVIPPVSSGTVSNTPQEINLPPGFGSSIVDSVRITGTANLINAAGAGRIGFRMYIDSTSAGTLDSTALAVDIPPDTVFGTNVTPVIITGDLSGALKTLFTASSLWVRLELTGTNAGAVAATGDMALTALQLRVVVQDKIF